MVNIANVNEMTMKAMRKLISAVMLFLTGCQLTDQITDTSNGQSYMAVMENVGEETRTMMDENRILWSSGDRIIVFEGKDSGRAFVLDAAYSGRSSGEFIAEGSSDAAGEDIGALVALYPYSDDVTISRKEDGSIVLDNILFPAEQAYVSSSFADSSFPMVSISPEGEDGLMFRNLGGVMHFSVKGEGRISKIYLSGNAGELISGLASVNLNQGSIPSVVMDEDAFNSVSLKCIPPVELSEDYPVDFHIALPPVKFSQGFTVSFESEYGRTVVRNTLKSNEVKRSAILHMPELNLSNDQKPAVDMGLSVKWAAWNVGAGRPEEYGDYYAWGELEEKASFTKTNYVYYDSQIGLYEDIGSDISGTEYDVASVEWGDGWRMPTVEELQELVTACTWSKANVEGVNGHNIQGPSGNSIFIPNTGYWQGSSLYFADDYMDGCFGCCWSATLAPDNAKEAYILNCENGMGAVVYRYWDRRLGLPVRPVKD